MKLPTNFAELQRGYELGLREIRVGSAVLPNPEHNRHSEDRALAMIIPNGESGIIAAIDGVGSGGEASAYAAQAVYDRLHQAFSQSGLPGKPTIEQGASLLVNATEGAKYDIRLLQKSFLNPSVDAVFAAAVICYDSRKYPHLVVASVGDCSVFQIIRRNTRYLQLNDHDSLVGAMVNSGKMPPSEAHTDPRRNLVTRTVGSIRGDQGNNLNRFGLIDPYRMISVYPFPYGEQEIIFLATTDGLTDNVRGLEDAFHCAIWGNEQSNPRDFTRTLATIARDTMLSPAPHAKPDDVSAAALFVVP